MLNKMFMRSWMLFGSFNMVKMQGTGYAQIMQPAIDEFYAKDEEKRKRALVRSNTFFNCTYGNSTIYYGVKCSYGKSKQ